MTHQGEQTEFALTDKTVIIIEQGEKIVKDKRVLLLILDGFGINPQEKGNAIKAANMPVYKSFMEGNPNAQLIASGKEVGLPQDIMGNSEVGHLNIGVGRIAYQLNVKIDKSIEESTFADNPAFKEALDQAEVNQSSLHIMGLMSDGNVHSNMSHIYPLLEAAKRRGLEQVYIHAFMDGRDTLPHSGKSYLAELEKQLSLIGTGRIATISGRYYAMDRDQNWDRVELAYKALVLGEGKKYNSALEAIEDSYDNEVTDEFVLPSVIMHNDQPLARIKDDDSVIFFNYRADRAREITSSFILPGFDKFKVAKFDNLKFVSFSEYDKNFSQYLSIAYPPDEFPNCLAEVISKRGLNQLHLAETEKYAHVTFFFNGGREKPYPGEDRTLVSSPKVATYDQKPEMSAYEVKDKLVQALSEGKYNFIVTNFANPDMVGHTGDFMATIKALEAVDQCLGEVIPEAEKQNYNIVLIADHGNADMMLDEDDNILTQHSTNPVPIIVSLNERKNYQVKNGRLSDVAPTILKIMGIPQPQEMTGQVLIET